MKTAKPYENVRDGLQVDMASYLEGSDIHKHGCNGKVIPLQVRCGPQGG